MYPSDNEIAGTIGAVPVCKACGSERVVRDAWACWNPDYGLWELEATFDDAHCHVCEGSTILVWTRKECVPRMRVRELNDCFRTEGRGNGSVVITAGLHNLGQEFMVRALEAVRGFDSFSDENDPWGEHDFGAVELDGEKFFWKIDYYDPRASFGSENPANEAVTHRVLTIMLASEY